MMAILSPAKNMREIRRENLSLTKPRYLKQTEMLWQQLRNYQPWELEGPLEINSDLAVQAYLNYQDFKAEKEGAAAVLAYTGLLYQMLDAPNFSTKELHYANDHLRIVSAFYGMLRPCDGIQPYRLELKSRLKWDGKSLYAFWSDQLCKDLYRETDLVINLTSQEYSAAIVPYLQHGNRMITCDFLTYHKGTYKRLPTYAKMARGRMAHEIVKNQWDDPEDLKDFHWGGFIYMPKRSTEDRYTFLKEER